MIGVNLCVSFYGAYEIRDIYCKIKSVTGRIIFADENHCTRVDYMVSLICFRR